MPLTVAVFLVGVSLATAGIFSSKANGAKIDEEYGVLGGPDASGSSIILSRADGAGFGEPGTVAAPATVAFASAGSSGSVSGGGDLYSSGAISAGGAAVQDVGTPVGPSFDRSGMISYIVRSGDNLSKIASYFGISIDTMVSANPGLRANSLRVGQTLMILPTSGVVYTTKVGDTLESISSAFGISQNRIRQFNGSVNFSNLGPGIPVVIPGGTANALIAAGNSALPNLNSDFIMPTKGYDEGVLHNYNAVDIAASCGTPVVAAAEGLVVPDPNIPDTSGGWNDGYGNFLLLEHPFGNGVETRYAHLSSVSVQIGDYVQQGEEIGLVGETGDATGCHLHFEVIGAQNPFAK